MSQINPFIGSILQSPQATRQQSVEKDRQTRQATNSAKNSALTDDQLDHQVESSEEVTPIHQDESHNRKFKRPQQHHHDDDSTDNPDEPSHLDIKG